jgi:hypothetical protein
MAVFGASGSEKRTVMADVKSTPWEPGAGEIDTTSSGVALLLGCTGPEWVCSPTTPIFGPLDEVFEPWPKSTEQPPATTATASPTVTRAGA